jgi:hypothetical protein
MFKKTKHLIKNADILYPANAIKRYPVVSGSEQIGQYVWEMERTVKPGKNISSTLLDLNFE